MMKRNPSEKCMMKVSLLQPSSSGHQTRLHRAKQGCLLLCPFSERISIHLRVLRHRYVCVAHVPMCPCVCACLQDIKHFSQKQEHPCILLFFIHLSWRLLHVGSDHPALLVVCLLVVGAWVQSCMYQPPSWETSDLCSKHSFMGWGFLHACSAPGGPERLGPSPQTTVLASFQSSPSKMEI